MRSRPRLLATAAAASLIALLAGCGDDDPAGGTQAARDGVEDMADDADDDADDFGDAIADAMGAGGGGTLFFDGEEIAIDSVFCMLDGQLFDVGTVSESGHRVLLSWTDELDPVSIQVLDADFQQWFAEGDAVYERDGKVFTSPRSTYWANGTDETREIGFTVECP